MDGLRLASAPLVPEVRLFLAEDPTILWARLEAGAGHRLPAPFWASAWSGGQAVARYVLDHPQVVAGRRVLDLASGSGIVAIAAALAGAARVIANDIDAYAGRAIVANAEINGVVVEPLLDDILDRPAYGGPEVVLVGDALYSDALAGRMLAFLAGLAGRGVPVLVGDPGRGRVPISSWRTVARYVLPGVGAGEDAQICETSVLTPRRDAGSSVRMSR